jgi:hypothetical protein
MGGRWPTRSQWKNWTLPNKATWVGLILAGVALILAIPPFVDWLLKLRPEPPFTPPKISIVSRETDAPNQLEGPLSVSIARNRRLHILSIKNPNAITLSALALRVQWPEAIVSARVATHSPNTSFEAFPAWDRQPLKFDGNVPLPAIEPFAGEEKTGLWQFSIGPIPPRSAVEVELVSSIGPEGGVYVEATSTMEKGKAWVGILWWIEARYQYPTGSQLKTGQVLWPLDVDKAGRLCDLRNCDWQSPICSCARGGGFVSPVSFPRKDTFC